MRKILIVLCSIAILFIFSCKSIASYRVERLNQCKEILDNYGYHFIGTKPEIKYSDSGYPIHIAHWYFRNNSKNLVLMNWWSEDTDTDAILIYFNICDAELTSKLRSIKEVVVICLDKENRKLVYP
jgi:hypothetical protein